MSTRLIPGETLPQLSAGPGPLKTVRGLGTITVDTGIVAELSPVSPPEGYCFAEPDTIKSPEVTRLYRQVEQNDATPDDFLEQRDAVLWSELLDVVNIGVRTVAGELSGFSSLAYYLKEGEGELCDLVVGPRHQRRGIAKALIAARLAIAERAGITDLYSPPLAPTNTLRTYYLELGFRETEAGELVFRQLRDRAHPQCLQENGACLILERMEARGFRPDEETITLPVQSGFEVGVDTATYTMRVYSGHEVEILAVDGMNASGPAVELYGDSGVGSEPEAGVIVADRTVWIARAGQSNKKLINLGKVASFRKVD